jgi:hypothetical protein
MTAKHVTAKSLIWRVEAVGHKICMDSSFSCLNLSDDLHTRAISCCGTETESGRDAMQEDFNNRTPKFKQDEKHVRVRSVFIAMTWKDKHGMSILINVHKPLAEVNS